MAAAPPAGSSRSSGSPRSSVRLRRAYTDFGRWARWAACPKTFWPKTWLLGTVRSGDPSCPPLGLHCAAARLRWAVVDKLKTPWTWLADSTVERGAIRALVLVSNICGRRFALLATSGGEIRGAVHFMGGMRPQNASRQLAVSQFAENEHGVAHRRELYELGLSPDSVKRWTADGRLHRVHRGVYAVGRRELSVHGKRLAAVKACGPGAVLSHLTAAV